MTTRLEPLIARIHDSAPKMVMAFAGAGAQALAWLHRVAGSSRTVLEATDHYAPASLTEAAGFTPRRFTAPEVAAALARRARARARALEPAGPVFGLGSSATIATDRRKRGQHRLVAAVEDAFGTASYKLVLEKGARSRAEEEELVSLILLRAIAEASGVTALPEPSLLPGERLETGFAAAEPLRRLAAGELPWLLVHPDGALLEGAPLSGRALLPGSFNPLHDGHRKLAAVARERLGREVVFELSLLNADKPPIALAEARCRALQFAGRAPLLLTRAPHFAEKACLFPESVFVMGADTAARLVAPRFYGDEAAMRRALETLRAQGARLLVAGRDSDLGFRTLRDLAIPEAARDLFEEVPASEFRMDISSSKLRAQPLPQS